jgi:hypothetical protein
MRLKVKSKKFTKTKNEYGKLCILMGTHILVPATVKDKALYPDGVMDITALRALMLAVFERTKIRLELAKSDGKIEK